MIYTSRFQWNRGSRIVFYALACLFLNSLRNTHLHWIIAEKSSSLVISMLNFFLFVQKCYLSKFLLKGRVSFQNIVKAESTPCLSKVKIKLKDFARGGGKAKIFIWKALLVLGLCIFQLAWRHLLFVILACKRNWKEVALSSASPSHSCHMDKMGFTWQSTQNGHKTMCQLNRNHLIHQEI